MVEVWRGEASGALDAKLETLPWQAVRRRPFLVPGGPDDAELPDLGFTVEHLGENRSNLECPLLAEMQ